MEEFVSWRTFFYPGEAQEEPRVEPIMTGRLTWPHSVHSLRARSSLKRDCDVI